MRVLLLVCLLAAASPGNESLEREVFRQVNQWRARQSLAPLRWNETAAEQARLHSTAMAEGRRPVGHGGFQARVTALSARTAVSSAAENIAASQGIPNIAATTVKGWATSPGHRKNMAGGFTEAGVGAATAHDGTVYVTQLFLKGQ